MLHFWLHLPLTVETGFCYWQLPVSSGGMKLGDDAVRVAVSLRLGCSICVAHILADVKPRSMFRGNTA